MPASAFFDENPLDLKIDGYSGIIFTVEDGSTIHHSTMSSDGRPLTGTVIKVTGVMADGKKTDYVWTGDVYIASKLVVKAHAYNNALTFLASDGTRATAKPVSSAPTLPASAFFDKNSLDLKVDGYASIMFTFADGTTISHPSDHSGGNPLSGSVIKVTGHTADGAGIDYHWTGHIVMPKGLGVRAYAYNNCITFLATDDTRATAKPDGSAAKLPSADFDKNPLEIKIDGHTNVVLTLATGSKVTYPAISTGGSILTGSVVSVLGHKVDGTETEYHWGGHVLMPKGLTVKVYAYNNCLTFLASDNTRATGKPVVTIPKAASAFFDKNPLDLNVNGYASIIFTLANGTTITYAAKSSGGKVLTGSITGVTGHRDDGSETQFHWTGHVVMPSGQHVKAFASNNCITFLSSDNHRATAKPV